MTTENCSTVDIGLSTQFLIPKEAKPQTLLNDAGCTISSALTQLRNLAHDMSESEHLFMSTNLADQVYGAIYLIELSRGLMEAAIRPEVKTEVTENA